MGLEAHPEPQLRAGYKGIRGHVKPPRPLGTWPETPPKCFGPPSNPPLPPLPTAAILASKGRVNTGGTSTNDCTSSSDQDDSSRPGQGVAGGRRDTWPLPHQSLCWEHGMGVGPLPWQLCSYPGVLEAAGAITAHNGDLGLVRVQWLDLEAVIRRGDYGGGVAPSPVLQEGRAPVSAWLCGIFQTLQEGVPVCAAEPEHGVEGDTEDGGQSHEEANGHGPAWVLVVVVGDRLVLDHSEN